MKRVLFLSLVLPLVAACGSESAIPCPEALPQPTSVVNVAGRLFVSAPLENGLRVIQLGAAADGDAIDLFVRAPNPLFGLQIPTVRVPHALAGVEAEGQRPLVASASGVDGQVRLVDATDLVAVGRPIPLPGRPVQIEFSGRQLLALVDRSEGNGASGALVVTDLEPRAFDPGASLDTDTELVLSQRQVDFAGVPGGFAVSAETVWVSDVQAPELLRVDLAGGVVERLPSPRRLGALLGSPAATVDGIDHPAGRWIYALSAEAPEFLAFDAVTGEVVEQMRWEDELYPVDLGSEGVAMATRGPTRVRGTVVLSTGTTTSVTATVPMLVLVSTAGGSVVYIDGFNMGPVDQDADFVPDPSVRVLPLVNALDENGVITEALDETTPQIETRPNPAYGLPGRSRERPHLPVVELTPGITRSRTWRVAWRDLLPGQTSVDGVIVADGSGVAMRPEAQLENLAQVAPGDVLTITTRVPAGSPEGCVSFVEAETLSWSVSAVESDRMRLASLEGGLPVPTTECFPTVVRYHVRASGYTVTGSDLPEVWRIQPGEVFRYESSRFARTETMAEGPDVEFLLIADQNEEAMGEGAVRQLIVQSGYDPIRFAPVPTTLQDVCGRRVAPPAMPRGAVFDSADALNHVIGYVPYAASGYLVSFDVQTRERQQAVR